MLGLQRSISLQVYRYLGDYKMKRRKSSPDPDRDTCESGSSCKDLKGNNCEDEEGNKCNDNCEDLKGNNCEDLKGNNCEDHKGNNCEDQKGNNCEDLKGNNCKDKKGNVCEDHKGNNCEDQKGNNCEDKKGNNCEDQKGNNCEDLKGNSCEDLKGNNCENKKGNNCEDHKGNNCEDKKGNNCEDHKGNNCEDKKGYNCEDKKGYNCEDLKGNNCEDKKGNNCEDQKGSTCEDGELCVCEGMRTRSSLVQSRGATQREEPNVFDRGNTPRRSMESPRIRWHDRLVMARKRAEWDEWASSLQEYENLESRSNEDVDTVIAGNRRGRSKQTSKHDNVANKRGRKRKCNQDIAVIVPKRSSVSFDPNLCVDACDEPAVHHSQTLQDTSLDWNTPEKKVRKRTKRNVTKIPASKAVRANRKPVTTQQQGKLPNRTGRTRSTETRGISKSAVSNRTSKRTKQSAIASKPVKKNNSVRKQCMKMSEIVNVVRGSKRSKTPKVSACDSSEPFISVTDLVVPGLSDGKRRQRYAFLKDTKRNCVISKDDPRLRLSKKGLERQKKLNEKTVQLTEFIMSDTCKNHLHQIIMGKVRSELHDTYYKGTSKERRNMEHRGFGPINDEEQVDKIWLQYCQWMKEWSADVNLHLAHYAMEVLVPEGIVFGLRKVKKYTKAKAWEMFDKGVPSTVEELKIVHYELLASSQSRSTNTPNTPTQSKVDNYSYPDELPDICSTGR